MRLALIAGIGKNNEIGKNGRLVFQNIPADMKYFQNTTKGHAVIMGRKTFESIGKALPYRRNIVITRDKKYHAPNIEVVHSFKEATDLVRTIDNEVFVIGGAKIYKEAIGKADKLYITHIDGDDRDADTFFPQIKENLWQKTKSIYHPQDNENAFDLEFAEYEKI